MSNLRVVAEPNAVAPFAVRTMLVRTSWAASGALGWATTRPTMKAITERFAKDQGLTVTDLRGQSRCTSIARARHELMWLLRGQGRWSYPQIGRFLGCRDHTTIIHGVRAHQKRLDEVVMRPAAE